VVPLNGSLLPSNCRSIHPERDPIGIFPELPTGLLKVTLNVL